MKRPFIAEMRGILAAAILDHLSGERPFHDPIGVPVLKPHNPSASGVASPVRNRVDKGFVEIEEDGHFAGQV